MESSRSTWATVEWHAHRVPPSPPERPQARFAHHRPWLGSVSPSPRWGLRVNPYGVDLLSSCKRKASEDHRKHSSWSLVFPSDAISRPPLLEPGCLCQRDRVVTDSGGYD